MRQSCRGCLLRIQEVMHMKRSDQHSHGNEYVFLIENLKKVSPAKTVQEHRDDSMFAPGATFGLSRRVVKAGSH